MNVRVCDAVKYIGPDCVLDHISIDIKPGQVTGLSGSNGSGKTMLMRAVCGLIHLDEGSIFVDEKILSTDLAFPPNLGMCIEGPAFLEGRTGYENLRLLADITGKVGTKEIRASMKRVGLDPDLKKKYRNFSLGMKQRLGIAAAIMERPDLLVLDEPSNALDSQGVEMLMDVLRMECGRGCAVLLSCHDGRILESMANTIYSMHSGRIIEVTSNE